MGLKSLLHVYYLTRTFVYHMHRAKMISLGRWPGDPHRRLVKTIRNLIIGLLKIVLIILIIMTMILTL